MDNNVPNFSEFLLEQDLNDLFEKYMSVNEAFGDKSPSVPDIIKAINERYYVGIYYEEPNDPEGVKSGFRLIEPYVYGRGYVNPQNGNVSNYQRQYVRAFVIKDTRYDSTTKNRKNFIKRKSVSKTNRVPYWRLLRVDRIRSWELIPRKFSRYRPLYNPDDKMLKRVIAKVSYDKFPKGQL